MPYRPLKRICWEKFLALHGWSFSGKVTGDHFIWKKKGALRSIPVWGNEKEIPALHIKTGCRTLGVSTTELYAWADTNC